MSGGIFSRAPKWDGAKLEESLIAADAGAKVAAAVVAELAKHSPPPEAAREKLAEILHNRLLCLQHPLEVGEARPFVILLAGVNGAGKTTTTAKLCRLFARQGWRVLLAAGDTFRAAAREQLDEWATRLGGVDILDGGAKNPSAAAFDAVAAAAGRGADIVLIDTAGRLPTQPHLMAELQKTRRAAGKAMANAPHETLLILDGTAGQNA
ncbi:MAG: signal recognition particle-docking protein FtsY, partial [Gammaproteobacteria bacterium]